MKKLLLLTAIITVIAVLAACTSTGDKNTSSDVVSTDVAESSDGAKVEDLNGVVETSSATGSEDAVSVPSSVIGGDGYQMNGASSNPVVNTSSNTTSSNSTTETSSTYTPSSSSSTSSESGNNGRPGNDNEGGWDEVWGENSGSATSSNATTSTPATPPTADDEEDETSSAPMASRDPDEEDPDGPGWIGGWW